MDKDYIDEAFKKLNIPTDNSLNYVDANEFAKNFKKCSILKSIETYYSSSTMDINSSINNKSNR